MTKQTEALKMALDWVKTDVCKRPSPVSIIVTIEEVKQHIKFYNEMMGNEPKEPEQEYKFGVYSSEDLDKAWKSGYDNCKAQSLWTLEDVKKAWKRGYAAAKKEQRQARVGIYTTPPQRKPLTDAQIDICIQQRVDPVATYRRLHDFARAIKPRGVPSGIPSTPASPKRRRISTVSRLTAHQ